MTESTKQLIFRGIEKKEQILFKSFLNLAKNDLSYDVVVVQDPDAPISEADLVIADADYAFDGAEQVLANLPMLLIGGDSEKAGNGYVIRPVQWSDFKEGIGHLSFDAPSNDVSEDDRVLPTKFALEIGDEEDPEIDEDQEVSRSFSDASDYNFSLDKMSIDYHSFTNSDYMKVVDDVKGFNEGDEPETAEAVVLVTDDESAAASSVLVIETNSLDAWDMEDSEFDEVRTVTVESPSQLEMPDLDAKKRSEVEKKIAAGDSLDLGAQFWDDDIEIIAGAETLMFIKAKENKVYSSREPGKWTSIMRKRELTRVPLGDDWRPPTELKVYPLDRVVWSGTLVSKVESLTEGDGDSKEYMLEKWPHFDLLELDNSLLKLTTMLFVGPESAYSLMQKTGESRAVVYGIINAAKAIGVLLPAEHVKQESYASPAQEEGMFGKIKEVFR